MATEEIIVRVSEKGVEKLKSLVALQENLEKVKRGGGNVDRALARVNKRIDKATGGAKGVALQFKRFKFELLGVLFFGMAVNRFLKGLLKPALEVTGAFDVMNFILTDLFLQTGAKVTDFLLDLADKFGQLNEPTKEFIGDMTLLGIAFGTVFLLAGIFGLALTSIAAALGLTVGGVLLLGAIIFVVAALIIGFIVLMKNWEKISTKVKLIIGVVAVVLGALAIALGAPIIGAVALVLGAFVLLRVGYDKLRASLGTTGFVDTIKAAFNKIIDKINDFLELINKIPGVNIPGFKKFDVTTSTPIEDVPFFLRPPGVGPIAGEFNPTTNIDVTVNTTGGVDGTSLAEQISLLFNESLSKELESISRR